MNVNTKADRVARLAREKARHDTAVTLGWPAVRRPRTAVEIEPFAFDTERRNRARTFASVTQAAKHMGISRRTAKRLRAA